MQEAFWKDSANWDSQPSNPWTFPTDGISLSGQNGQTVNAPEHLISMFEGEGTTENPYKIKTPSELTRLATLVNSLETHDNYGGENVHYLLMDDIDLSVYGSNYNDGKGWIPIGTNSPNTTRFEGIFDGNGNKITGFVINDINNNSAGLFGAVYMGGVVKNLGVEGVNIKAYRGGGISGRVDGGTIQNCYSTGTISGGSGGSGGIAGTCSTSAAIKNCYSTSDVSSSFSSGGIVGAAENSTIVSCYSIGAISSDDRAGGIIGYIGASGFTLKNCVALNPSIVSTYEAGRISGQINPYIPVTLQNNFAFVDILGDTWADKGSDKSDGIDINPDDLTEVFWIDSEPNGVCFSSSEGWTISVDGTSLPGLNGQTVPMSEHLLPLIGTESNPYKIRTAEDLARFAERVNNSETNSVYGGEDAYYLLMNDIDLSAYGKHYNDGKGWIPIGIMYNLEFRGTFDGDGYKITGLTINDPENGSMGLFKYLDRAVIKNLNVEGADIKASEVVGIIAASVNNNAIIENCYTTGILSTVNNNTVGGIAGSAADTLIKDCGSAAAITSKRYVNSYAGGIIGDISHSLAIVQNCVALNPSVTGINNIGRVAGGCSLGTLENNLAFSKMAENAWTSKGVDDLDGEDITAITILKKAFWIDELFFNEALWTFNENMLPVLTDVGDPRSGDLGIYLLSDYIVTFDVDNVAVKDIILTLQVGDIHYELPPAAINTWDALKILGASADDANKVEIEFIISSGVSSKAYENAVNAIGSLGAEIISSPVEFSVIASYAGKKTEIHVFDKYVKGFLRITEAEAKRLSTAVIVEENGLVRHIPSYVQKHDDGSYYAVFNSITNSTYALISNGKAFTDAIGMWYEKSVNEMGSRLIIHGINKTEFAGGKDISRGEFVAIVIRALGLPQSSAGSMFSDVSDDKWYSGSIGSAYLFGLVSGVEVSSQMELFMPDRAITREEAAVIMQRAAGIIGYNGVMGDASGFMDFSEVSPWAAKAFNWNVGSGLIFGSYGKINPKNNVTRAEAAALVFRLLQNSKLISSQ